MGSILCPNTRTGFYVLLALKFRGGQQLVRILTSYYFDPVKSY